MSQLMLETTMSFAFNGAIADVWELDATGRLGQPAGWSLYSTRVGEHGGYVVCFKVTGFGVRSQDDALFMTERLDQIEEDGE